MLKFGVGSVKLKGRSEKLWQAAEVVEGGSGKRWMMTKDTDQTGGHKTITYVRDGWREPLLALMRDTRPRKSMVF
jgi:hypothetical protein